MPAEVQKKIFKKFGLIEAKPEVISPTEITEMLQGPCEALYATISALTGSLKDAGTPPPI